MSEHAALGASSSHRWIACPGSIALYDILPPGVGAPSVHAAEGSAAHALGEMCLLKNTEPHIYMGTSIDGFEIDEEMVDAVSLYVDFCRSTLKGPGGGALSWVEKKFSLNALNPPAPMFGTADFIAYNDMTFTVDVVDLKYGRGVLVHVEGNPQLHYYGLGAVLELQRERPDIRIDKVRLTIVQPRIEHRDGMIRTVELDFEDLLAFASELMEAARRTTEPNAPRVPGEHCRWCRGAAVCPEKAEQSLAVAQAEFDVAVAPPEPSTLAPEELQWVLEQLPAFEDWVGKVRQYATEVLEHGGDVPGFKLVQKRACRRWTSEAALKEWGEEVGLTEEDLSERKLSSPAQLEKRLGRNSIPEDLIVKESSGVTLAPEWDKRPAVTVGQEFPLLPNPENTTRGENDV